MFNPFKRKTKIATSNDEYENIYGDGDQLVGHPCLEELDKTKDAKVEKTDSHFNHNIDSFPIKD